MSLSQCGQAVVQRWGAVRRPHGRYQFFFNHRLAFVSGSSVRSYRRALWIWSQCYWLHVCHGCDGAPQYNSFRCHQTVQWGMFPIDWPCGMDSPSQVRGHPMTQWKYELENAYLRIRRGSVSESVTELSTIFRLQEESFRNREDRSSRIFVTSTLRTQHSVQIFTMICILIHSRSSISPKLVHSESHHSKLFHFLTCLNSL